jgi:U4/U6 small nuclear ribonucleoprotein PRP4
MHDISFHPLSGKGLGMNAPNIATGSSDNDVRLWSLNNTVQNQKSIPLRGHKDRVNRVIFHTSGDYLFSGSYD